MGIGSAVQISFGQSRLSGDVEGNGHGCAELCDDGNRDRVHDDRIHDAKGYIQRMTTLSEPGSESSYRRHFDGIPGHLIRGPHLLGNLGLRRPQSRSGSGRLL